MKAIVQAQYGSPDVLQLQEVEKPTPKDDEILVQVHTATATPADSAFRKGEPFIIKLMYGLQKPRKPIGGVEFAGEIKGLGRDVTSFKVGDQVVGISPDNFGAYAEYMTLPEKKPVVIKSPKMTFEEAVGICDGALTALTFLRDKANIQPRQKVLINGASGAVGIYAVQLARYFGAEVTGVCSHRNIEMVKSYGAHYVIDYTQEDFTQNGQTYDVIFDAIGKSSFTRCKNSLISNGKYLSTVPSWNIMLNMLRTSLFGNKKVIFVAAGLQQSKDNLNFLNARFEAGEIKAVIDRCYPLTQIAEAHRYVDTERKCGNVIINIR